MRTRWTTVIVAVLVLVGVGCSSEADVGLPQGGQPTPGGSLSPGVQPTVADEPTAGDDASGTAGAGDADVTASSFRFEPSTIEVERDAELTVANTDETIDHTFTVEDEDIDEILPAGADATIALDLPTGSYTVVCRFHEDQGMRATLEIG